MSKIHEALNKIRSSQQDGAIERLPAARVEQSRKGASSLPVNGGAHSGLQVVSTSEPIAISMDALRDARLIVPRDDSQLLTSQLREIKRPLIAHAFGKRATKISDGNLLLVSSALAGEGKTFISLNLALSIAQEQDHSAVLIDADVARPRLTQALDASDKKGLLDYLEDSNLHLGAVLLQTDIPGFSFIPAGRPRPNSTELLSSSRMEELMERLHSRANGEIAIFDGPPILQTTESKVLASLVGQIVLVVCAEKTPHSALVNAVSALDPRKPVNLVLNKVGSKAFHSRYAYGFSYEEASEFNRPTSPGQDIAISGS